MVMRGRIPTFGTPRQPFLARGRGLTQTMRLFLPISLAGTCLTPVETPTAPVTAVSREPGVQVKPFFVRCVKVTDDQGRGEPKVVTV